MSENVYDIGDKPTLTATFRHPTTKVLVDPDVVVCTVRPPGVPKDKYLTPTVIKVSTGVYEAKVELDRAGRWWYAFDGAGTFQSSEERSLNVRTRNVPR